ncbi:DUF6510 family protein [Nocardia sp. NPDC004068]|uniref:DUF6510 family protein n=1 Tax=Nocardia sp. NPDC004068 TaxID=3364303 RepID=UPI0036C1E982
MSHLDGNALAGILSELFAADVTACPCRCGGCGNVRPVAAMLVYTRAPGTVARCPGCHAEILTLTVTPHGRWLRLGDGVSLHFPLDPHAT